MSCHCSLRPEQPDSAVSTPEYITDPFHPGRRTRPLRSARRVHHRKSHHQGPHDNRADQLHHPPSAYDLRKLRDKDLLAKPGRSRRYTYHHNQPAPSLPFSHYANRSSHPSWPVSAAHAWDATPHLGPGRPRLRNPPHQHAGPLPRPRHHYRHRRGIDNFLSIEVRKLLERSRGVGSLVRVALIGAGR
jgi:hypothetical protein